MTFWGVKVIADVIPRSIRGTERYVIKATRCNWESLRKDYFNCSVCLAIMFANWYFSLGLNKVWQDEREINNQMKLWLPEGKPKSIIFPLIFIQIGFPVGVSTHKGVLPPILRLNHYKAVKNTTPETRVSIPQNSPWKGENKVEPKKKVVHFLFITQGIDPLRKYHRNNPRMSTQKSGTGLPMIKMDNFNLPLVALPHWLDKQILVKETICVFLEE